MTRVRAQSTVMNWVCCNRETAELILTTPWPLRGATYFARILDEDYVEIYRDGILIHRIFVF